MHGVGDEVTFLSSRDFINALQEEVTASGLARSTRVLQGSGEERERYAFDLASVACLATIFVAGITTTKVGLALTRAYKKVRTPYVEFKGPRGYVRIDLDGKTEEEIAQTLQALAPVFQDMKDPK
jgi:hypothetical protein